MKARTQVVRSLELRPGSLLTQHLEDADYQDSVSLQVQASASGPEALDRLMGGLLQGFIDEPSGLVSLLMRVRNQLVRPLGLRRSRLGCPVSSLLSAGSARCYAGRYPVLDQRVDPQGRTIEVLLGADDKHLRFRTCVGLHRSDDGELVISLATRVRTVNAFGRFYMRAIHTVHHRLIAPLMLRKAAAFALRQGVDGQPCGI